MQRATGIRITGRGRPPVDRRARRAGASVSVRRTFAVRAARVGVNGIAAADRFSADAMTATAVVGAGALLLLGVSAVAAVAWWLLWSQASLALVRQGRIGLARSHQNAVAVSAVAVGLLGLTAVVLAAEVGSAAAAWLAAGAAVGLGARSHRLLVWTLPVLLVVLVAWLKAPLIPVLAGAAIVAGCCVPRRSGRADDGSGLLGWGVRQGRSLLVALAMGGGLALMVIAIVPMQAVGRVEAAAALLMATSIGFAARRGLWGSLRAALWDAGADAGRAALRVRARLLSFALASLALAAATVAAWLTWGAVWAPFALLGVTLAVASAAVELGAREATAWLVLAAGLAVAAGVAPEPAIAVLGVGLVAVVVTIGGDLPRLGLQVRPQRSLRRRRA